MIKPNQQKQNYCIINAAKWVTLETTLLLISGFWYMSLFHHISDIVAVPPTKFSKIACSIAAHYLKWVYTFRSSDTMIPVLFQVLARKVVLTLTGPLNSGWEWRHNFLLQQGCRAACQVLHKSNLFLQHGCEAARQVLNESNWCQQYGCRTDCQVPN